MCGIVAVINKLGYGLNKEQCDIFDALLFIDQLRGMDSTGVFVVAKDNSMSLAKEASNATIFRTRKDYDLLMQQAFNSGAAVVGHNRAATKGVVTDANAHPFVVDDRITLVHNGTLFGDHTKLAKTEVDSHAIAHVIHENGDDVEKALQQINGAYALVWHDYKNETLNFIRNSQRPLHWIETPTSWIWASEANMLDWVVSKFSLKVEGKVSMLEANTLCIYKLNKGKWDIENKKIEPYKSSTPSSSTNYDNWPYHTNRRYGTYLTDDEDTDNVVPFVPTRTSQAASTTLSGPSTARIESIEEDLAIKAGAKFSWAVWSRVCADSRSGEEVSIVCKDYAEVVPERPELGYFMYGCLENENDILVRIHLNKSWIETDLLDLALNERKATMVVKVNTWRAYSKERSTELGVGYGIIQGENLKPVGPALVLMKEKLDA